MDSGAKDVERVGALGVGKLKSGVDTSWVASGDEKKDGVEACNVANRSGVELTIGRLQLISMRTKEIVETSLSLLIQFNRLKIKFFTR